MTTARQPKTFAVGDIHGNFKALMQVIERSGFDSAIDTLISVGDLADGYPDVRQCIDYCIGLSNFISVKGNHDHWVELMLEHRLLDHSHMYQGGLSSLRAYSTVKRFDVVTKRFDSVIDADVEWQDMIIENHLEKFYAKQKTYYIDDKDRIYIHGGFDLSIPIEEHGNMHLMWDREMSQNAIRDMHHGMVRMQEKYSKIFIGHTNTLYLTESDKPLSILELRNLDTGASYPTGRLTIMNVDTDEYWQSDLSKELYPDYQPRGL